MNMHKNDAKPVQTAPSPSKLSPVFYVLWMTVGSPLEPLPKPVDRIASCKNPLGTVH